MDSQTATHPENEHLRWYVYDYCGGPTKASFALQVSAAAIHNWLTAGRVLSLDKAVDAANHSGWKVTPAQLLGVPEAPPKVAPDPREETNTRVGKGSARSVPPQVATSGRLAEAGTGLSIEKPRKSAGRKRSPSSAAGSRRDIARTVTPDFYDAERHVA